MPVHLRRGHHEVPARLHDYPAHAPVAYVYLLRPPVIPAEAEVADRLEPPGTLRARVGRKIACRHALALSHSMTEEQGATSPDDGV